MTLKNSLIFYSLVISRCLAAENDQDLALAMALSLAEQEKKLVTETDAAIAHSLQDDPLFINPDEILALKVAQLSLDQKTIYTEAQQVISPLINQYKTYHDKDVHAFNKAMNWPTTLPQLIGFFDKIYPDYISHSPCSFFESLMDTLSYNDLNDTDKQEFIKNRDLLITHTKSSMVEASETAASLDHLLSRLWILSLINGDDHHRLISLLVPVMIDNIATGGGCYPGFAGRLCGIFLVMMNDLTRLANED